MAYQLDSMQFDVGDAKAGLRDPSGPVTTPAPAGRQPTPAAPGDRSGFIPWAKPPEPGACPTQVPEARSASERPERPAMSAVPADQPISVSAGIPEEPSTYPTQVPGAPPAPERPEGPTCVDTTNWSIPGRRIEENRRDVRRDANRFGDRDVARSVAMRFRETRPTVQRRARNDIGFVLVLVSRARSSKRECRVQTPAATFTTWRRTS